MARGVATFARMSESRRGRPSATDERRNGMRGTPPSRQSRASERDVDACPRARGSRARCGEVIASRREIFCANRRIRACAARNPLPFEEVFLACVQTVPTPVDALPGSTMRARRRCRWARIAKKNARFPDVFFMRAFQGRDARRDRWRPMGCIHAGRRRRMRRAGRKKVAARC